MYDASVLLVVASSCVLLFFPSALTDFVAELRNPVRQVSPGFISTGRSDQNADPYSDAYPDEQRTDRPPYVRVFFPAKSAGCSANAIRRGSIRIPNLILYVVHIVWEAFTD
jgi:hypothetical protein